MQTRAQQQPWQLKPLLVALAVASLALACKSSDDKPTTPDETSAGSGGDFEQPGDGPGGANAGGAGNAQGGAGTNPVGEGGELNLPVGGAGPTEPGSWDQSFWDDAVWQ